MRSKFVVHPIQGGGQEGQGGLEFVFGASIVVNHGLAGAPAGTGVMLPHSYMNIIDLPLWHTTIHIHVPKATSVAFELMSIDTNIHTYINVSCSQSSVARICFSSSLVICCCRRLQDGVIIAIQHADVFVDIMYAGTW